MLSYTGVHPDLAVRLRALADVGAEVDIIRDDGTVTCRIADHLGAVEARAPTADEAVTAALEKWERRSA